MDSQSHDNYILLSSRGGMAMLFIHEEGIDVWQSTSQVKGVEFYIYVEPLSECGVEES